MSSSGSFRVKKRVGDPLRCRSRLRIPTNIDADYFVHVELGETQVLRKITLQPGCKSSSRACLDLISGSRLRHRIVFVQNIRNGKTNDEFDVPNVSFYSTCVPCATLLFLGSTPKNQPSNKLRWPRVIDCGHDDFNNS